MFIVNTIKNITKYFIGFVFVLLICELVLSFLPVNTPIRTHPLYLDSNPFDVSATKSSKITFSNMSFFDNAIKRKTNSLGFFSDYEYEDDFNGNFVIGDSQVESGQVEFSNTFHQIIAKKINSKVYNIGISGAPLSQYHAYTNEICKRYKPKNILILIIPNDLRQSLKKHRIRNGWFHYDENNLLKVTTYEISWYRSLANKSSLVRYLYFNLRVGSLYRKFFRGYSDTNTESDLSKKNDLFLNLDKKAIDIFFNTFNPNCVSKKKVLFILDANRYEKDEFGRNLYNNGSTIPSFKYFKKISKIKGYDVLDLNEYFKNDYKRNSIKFEASKYDNHWGKYAHIVAANAILKFKNW